MKSNKPKYKIDNSKLSRLVEKAKNGSEKATEEVVNMVSGYIYYYSLTMLCDDEKARDAVQDILLTMLKKLNTIDDPKAFLGWIKTVTANYCKTRISRSKENLSLDDGSWELADANDQTCPSKSAETNEVCLIVRSAVTELPSTLRESVMMFYYNQMSVHQIVETLEVNENTVKSRLFSARQKMKKSLEQYGRAALACCPVPPLTLISFSLIRGAEQQKATVIPFTTPAGRVKVAAVNSAAVTGFSVKAAAIGAACVIGIGGIGVAASTLAPHESSGVVAASAPKSYAHSAYDYMNNDKHGPKTMNHNGGFAEASYEKATQAQSASSPLVNTQTYIVPASSEYTQTQPATSAERKAAISSTQSTVPSVTAPDAQPVTAVPATTVPVTTEPAEMKVYIDTSVMTLESQLFCHIYEKGGDPVYQWAGKNEYCVKVSENLYSYDLSGLNLKAGDEYYIMLGSKGGAQTDALLLSSSNYGGTIILSVNSSLAPTDSEKKSYVLNWK